MRLFQFTIYLLWPLSIMYWYVSIITQMNLHEARDLQLKESLENSLSKHSTPLPAIEKSSDSLLGLFGKIDSSFIQAKAPPKKIIHTDPASLEGIFIDKDKAWAIIKDRKNQSTIIQPEQIRSFNRSSITLVTSSGIKSLHLKNDKGGMNIHVINRSSSQNTKTAEKIISRAEKLRIQLLNKARSEVSVTKKAAN